jgi:hypothetical protein
MMGSLIVVEKHHQIYLETTVYLETTTPHIPTMSWLMGLLGVLEKKMVIFLDRMSGTATNLTLKTSLKSK